VYCDGEYWGETSKAKPVGIIWRHSSGARRTQTCLSLKKRGYKTTTYYMTVRRDYATEAQARDHPQKVLVVLDTE